MNDTKYAMIFRERIIPLTRSGTLEQAEIVACEELWDLGCEGDDIFEIIEIAAHKKYSVGNFDEWFKKKGEELRTYRKQQAEARDKAEFERLEKKYGKFGK